MSGLLCVLPPALQTLWGMLEELQFGEVPDYAALRAALLPAAPAVRSNKRVFGLSWPARGAPAGPAQLPQTGPQEPNGKRLRAAMAAGIMREE